jgi:hypothetical protein
VDSTTSEDERASGAFAFGAWKSDLMTAQAVAPAASQMSSRRAQCLYFGDLCASLSNPGTCADK